jgi:hypothetical protein
VDLIHFAGFSIDMETFADNELDRAAEHWRSASVFPRVPETRAAHHHSGPALSRPRTSRLGVTSATGRGAEK